MGDIVGWAVGATLLGVIIVVIILGVFWYFRKRSCFKQKSFKKGSYCMLRCTLKAYFFICLEGHNFTEISDIPS